MYCAMFTGFYDKKVNPNKIYFAKNDYNIYDYNNNILSKVYVKKFYMHDNEIKMKYLYFGQKSENTGTLFMLLKKQKKKYFKLNNYKNIKEFIRKKGFKNARNNGKRYL